MASSNNGDGKIEGRITRRTLLQASGFALGGSLLGSVGIDEVAAATADAWDGFRNWRAIEAEKVWNRGYRGRTDRTIGLTDTGLDARHPDLGPWNGVQAFVENGELKLTRPAENTAERVESGESESFSGTVGPGSFATGEEVYHEFTTPSDVDELDAELSWSPNADASNDLEFRLDVWTGERWETEARTATASMPERLEEAPVDGDTRYRFVVEVYVNTTTTYEITGTYFDREGTIYTYDDSVVFEDTDGTVTADTPKTVGWYNEANRFGRSNQPRDPDGHGTHVASIMGGSGRASAIDEGSLTIEEPGTTLDTVTGEMLTYNVDAAAGTGVFASAYGEAIELYLYAPDGTELDYATIDTDDSADGDKGDNVVVEAPAETTGTYRVEVKTAEGVVASSAYVGRIASGAFEDPGASAVDRVDNGGDGLHSGVAPNHSLVGMQGFSAPTEDVGRFGDQFAETFNLRAVNMSWGYRGGLPLGAAAGTLDRIPAVIKEMAQAGIITLAAAGNAATPANGNGSPAVADEAVSVCATGPLDGISGYSSGGIGGVDEDDEEAYMKPDVTAPGGTLTDAVNAAKAGNADAPEDQQPPIRDYTDKPGTSMAAPYTTGTTGLLAQAMEEDGGPRLSLPDPADATIDDVYRMKHVLLATASETALTAAPYHRAKTPTYDFGGRDPYEGYGRINPDAAVDAVTRELSGTTSEQLGLNLPDDSRAVAGYVDLGVGELEASVEFTGYGGSDADLATGAPHVDLFVYDGGNPADHGEPNVVDRAAGPAGSASVSAAEKRGGGGSTYLVVAKLVDVPGAVNGDDVQVNLDLTVDKTPGVRARGRRKDDESLLGAGVLSTVEVTVEPDEDVMVRDVVPEEWGLITDLLSVVTDEEAGVKYVELGRAPAGEETTFTYEVETPTDLLDFSKEHLFGPVQIDDGSGWTGVSGTTGTKEVKGD